MRLKYRPLTTTDKRALVEAAFGLE